MMRSWKKDTVNYGRFNVGINDFYVVQNARGKFMYLIIPMLLLCL